MESCPAGQFCLSHAIVAFFFIILIAGLTLLYLQQQKQSKNTTPTALPPVNVVIQKEKPSEEERRRNKWHRRYYDDLDYPEKEYIRSVPINIPTRGELPYPQQLGVLASDDGSQVLPLFGGPTYPGSNKYKYYTSTANGLTQLKLPVSSKKKDCMSTYGCDELYDGDHINVPILQKDMKVSIYANDTPRYIPFV